MLVATFCTWSLAFGSLTFHLLPLLAERGVSDAVGIALLASVGPLQIAGRVGLMLHRGAMPARLLGRALTVMLVAAVLILYAAGANIRSEEHTSELQSLMRISYAVFCLKKK